MKVTLVDKKNWLFLVRGQINKKRKRLLKKKFNLESPLGNNGAKRKKITQMVNLFV